MIQNSTTSTLIVETLCSHCSCVLTSDHRHMEPRLFKAIICLRENIERWDIELVQSMIAGLLKERLSKYDYTTITTRDEGAEYDYWFVEGTSK